MRARDWISGMKLICGGERHGLNLGDGTDLCGVIEGRGIVKCGGDKESWGLHWSGGQMMDGGGTVGDSE